MKKTLLKFASKAFNKSESELEEELFNGDELKDNADELLLQMNAERVKQFKDEMTVKHDEGYKKAEKKFKSEGERMIKDILSIDSDLEGDELISEARKQLEEKTSRKSSLKDEDVKKHPLFLEREKQLQKELNDAVAAKENEFNEYKNNIVKTEKIGKVKNKAVDIMASLNPILPGDNSKAENMKRLFLKEFDSFDYEMQEDGSIVIISEGKRLENKQGYPVSFDEFVKEKTLSYFDVKQQDAKGSTGNGSEPKQPAKPTNNINYQPKTLKERNEAINILVSSGNIKEVAAVDKFYNDNKID